MYAWVRRMVRETTNGIWFYFPHFSLEAEGSLAQCGILSLRFVAHIWRIVHPMGFYGGHLGSVQSCSQKTPGMFYLTWFLCLADLFLPRKALFPKLSRTLISKPRRWHLAAATMASSLWALHELAGQALWCVRAGLETGIRMADYSPDHRCSVALKFTKSMFFSFSGTSWVRRDEQDACD